MNILQTDWTRHQQVLSDIRYRVFVEEQAVPVELEIDDADATARHWLAFIDNTPVATLRLLDSGSIGRMAVLSAYRGQGIGRALMGHCIAAARALGFTRLSLAAQVHAIPFYELMGFAAYGDEFMDAGIPHRFMSMTLPGRDDGLGFQRHKKPVSHPDLAILQLATESRRYLDIFSHHLEPDIYSNDALTRQISLLARRHSGSRVRLLIRDDRALRETRHPLVALYRRLSAVELRVLSANQTDEAQTLFALSDHKALVVFPAGGTPWQSENLPPAAREYRLRFDQLWGIAKESPWLRRLI